jgi:hypothetical protein
LHELRDQRTLLALVLSAARRAADASHRVGAA